MSVPADLPQPVLSTGDKLRAWALSMRAVLEANGGTSMWMQLENGTELDYRLGHGLTVTIGAESWELPEPALDDEKWVVAQS